MNTLYTTTFGVIWAVVFCAIMKITFMLGWGEPNVIPEAGETYAGWWAMLFFCSVAAWAFWGVVFDTFGMVSRFFSPRKV